MFNSDNIQFIIILATAVASGLVAGLLFIFSVCIMPALRQSPPAEGMAVMQRINVAIINPLFLIAFIGPAVTSIWLLIAGIRQGNGYLIAASVVYLVGMLGVTMAFNIPRNNALDTLEASAASSLAYWAEYLQTWTMWNHLRTAAAIISATLFTLAVAL